MQNQQSQSAQEMVQTTKKPQVSKEDIKAAKDKVITSGKIVKK